MPATTVIVAMAVMAVVPMARVSVVMSAVRVMVVAVVPMDIARRNVIVGWWCVDGLGCITDLSTKSWHIHIVVPARLYKIDHQLTSAIVVAIVIPAMCMSRRDMHVNGRTGIDSRVAHDGIGKDQFRLRVAANLNPPVKAGLAHADRNHTLGLCWSSYCGKGQTGDERQDEFHGKGLGMVTPCLTLYVTYMQTRFM